MVGEHHQPTFVAINPNRLVPVLEHGDLRLTEKELKSWAPVNEHLYGFAAAVKDQTFVTI
jgi:hypothetical protein